jgi:hypothetical protein
MVLMMKAAAARAIGPIIDPKVIVAIWSIGQELARLRAVVIPNDERALRHWREWSTRVDIEEVDWQDHRMLAALVGPLRRIDPNYPMR